MARTGSGAVESDLGFEDEVTMLILNICFVYCSWWQPQTAQLPASAASAHDA